MIPSLSEAKNLVPRPNMDRVVRYADGMTSDIQAEILDTAKLSKGSTVALAKRLKGKTPMESARNVHAFTRQIRYVEDPAGKQYIKTPSRTIYDGFSDCKGYSILIHSLLTDLGIRNGFRFHAYRPGPVTHIFNVAEIDGKQVFIDACLPGFGNEAAHLRQETVMPRIERLSGPGILGADELGAILGNLSENGIPRVFEIDAADHEVLAELKGIAETYWHESQVAGSIHGIGSPLHTDMVEGLADYVTAIQGISAGDANALDRVVAAIEGRIPGRSRRVIALRQRIKSGTASPTDLKTWKELRAARKAKGIHEIGALPGAIGRKKRRANLLKRAGQKIKTAAKRTAQAAGRTASRTVRTAGRTAGRVVRTAGRTAGRVVQTTALAPARLIVRTLLPKAAPFFLYLFITNPETIRTLPPKVARKRRKAVALSRFITNGLGMKSGLFMRIVRNGIQRKYKATPEQVLARHVRGKINGLDGVEGIGFIDVVIQLIGQLSKILGRKPEENIGPDDAPDPANDWESTPVKSRRKVLSHMKNKPFSQRGQEPAEPEEEEAQETADTAAQDQVEAEPEETALDDPLPDAEPVDPVEENF